ncbi:DUF421 domain-containing protein [Mucilaginibacter sp. Bleaf8]|uniref:DUF421 domain-containing protein n=1 Tax=Mucilaginibacter sp. Bleaf8 TaxID=2834430 RepID=UPI001BCAE11B|nr:YetF domain-containing protein [Mucilaginibacter sp. Bleaf8]MBS7566044.1 DUF421 domain-containing protein [Mucilaginibacter sp. Bleaf8]
MEWIDVLFGEGKDLNVLQMCSRALMVFFIALLLIRLSGRRTFGKRSAFDNTLAIILGAVLSRAVAGASPFIPTVCCSLLLVLLHRLLAWLSVKNEWINRLLKGDTIPLYKDGEIKQDNLSRSLVSRQDIMSDLRLKANTNSLTDVDEINMETSGEVSVIKKNK